MRKNGQSTSIHSLLSLENCLLIDSSAKVFFGLPACLMNALRSYVLTPWHALFPSIDANAHVLAREAAVRRAWTNRTDLFRVILVVMANMLLLLFPKTLNVLGQAAFFGMIVGIILVNLSCCRRAKDTLLSRRSQGSKHALNSLPVRFNYVGARNVSWMGMGCSGYRSKSEGPLPSTPQKFAADRSNDGCDRRQSRH